MCRHTRKHIMYTQMQRSVSSTTVFVAPAAAAAAFYVTKCKCTHALTNTSARQCNNWACTRLALVVVHVYSRLRWAPFKSGTFGSKRCASLASGVCVCASAFVCIICACIYVNRDIKLLFAKCISCTVRVRMQISARVAHMCVWVCVSGRMYTYMSVCGRSDIKLQLIIIVY